MPTVDTALTPMNQLPLDFARRLPEIARQCITPFYAFDLTSLIDTFSSFADGWRSALPSASVVYSYKTNPMPEITRLLRACGAGADVVSEGELRWALKDGFPVNRIHFNGPVKSRSDLETAIERNSYIHLDSLDELDLLLRAKHDQAPQIILRLSCMLADGRRSRFGMTVTEVVAARKKMAAAGVPLRGFHFHAGSNLSDTTHHVRTICEYAEVLRQVSMFQSSQTILSVGGGYPARSNDNFVSTTGFSSAIRQAIEVCELRIERFQLVAEPGRALVQDIGYLVLGVVARKFRNGRHILVVDGGTNITAHFGRYERTSAFLNGSSKDIEYDIYGPLCYESDLILKGLKGPPDLGPGGIVVVASCGAYDLPLARRWGDRRVRVVVYQGGELRDAEIDNRIAAAASPGEDDEG